MRQASKNRRKILFFAEAVTLSHVARPAVLAGSLDSGEFDVVLAAHPRYRHLFSDLKVRQINIHSISSELFLSLKKAGKPHYDAGTLEQYVEEDLKIIDNERPDIIVGDFRLSLSISARLRKKPYVAITNAHWSPFARQKWPTPQDHLASLVGVRMAQLLFTAIRPLAFKLHALPLNGVRQKYGLPSLGLNLPRIYTDSDYLLYADIPGLVKMEELPTSHHFIGPVYWSPPTRNPDWWDQLDESKPVVYVTLGSSGRSDLMSRILEALAQLPVWVIVATAGRFKTSLSQDNVFAASYLPGEKAAARSRLVICNGGSPATYQSLSQGVPVLGIADNLDQHLNMCALERLGAGISLRLVRSGPDTIRKSALRLMEEDRFTQSAERIEKRLARYRAPDRFQQVLREI